MATAAAHTTAVVDKADAADNAAAAANAATAAAVPAAATASTAAMSEKFIQGMGPYSCADVTEFINSLDGNASITINDFEAICNIIQLFDFDECRGSRIKNQTFNQFGILLRRFSQSIPRSSSLSISLTYILEKFDFLKKAFELVESQSFIQRMRTNVKLEFFRLNGGDTNANKNIYDLVMYQKEFNEQQRLSKMWIKDRATNAFALKGGYTSNRQKKSHLHFLKKHFRVSRKNKSRSRRRKTSKTSKRN